MRGYEGNDSLYGGLGNDVLTGGANNDFFVFNTALNSTTNRDKITDFNHAADTIMLENAVFTKLGRAGAMDPHFFHVGTKAADANDYIVYNHSNGFLMYDADANGSGGAIVFAALNGTPTIGANDFVIF